MKKRIIVLIIVLFNLLPGLAEKNAVHAQAEETDWGMCGDNPWGLDYSPPDFDWNSLWDLVNQIDEQNWNEHMDWVNEMNELVSDWIAESDAIWSDFFDTPTIDYSDYVDWWNMINSPPPPPSGPSAPLCPTVVGFKEFVGGNYGYDNYTDPIYPWQSIESGHSDKVLINVTPAAAYTAAYFKNMNTANITLSDTNATASVFNLTITSATMGSTEKKRETELKGTCGSTNGSVINKMNVATYNVINKTVAVRLVNSAAHTSYAGYSSTNISDADIVAYLEKVYKQGIIKWTVVRLADKTIDFDLDSDSKIDVSSWMTAEMGKVRDSAKDDTYDKNIFLVDNSSDASNGYSDFNQRYVFVHANQPSASKITCAHEIGHSLGLTHTLPDLDNIMYNYGSTTKYRLRKAQWDLLHP